MLVECYDSKVNLVRKKLGDRRDGVLALLVQRQFEAQTLTRRKIAVEFACPPLKATLCGCNRACAIAAAGWRQSDIR